MGTRRQHRHGALDRTSLELYANDGLAVACSYEFEQPQDCTLSISANKNVQVNSLLVNELKSAWVEP